MRILLSACMLLALSSTSALMAKGQAEPGDIKKGEGKGHKRLKEIQPGDVKGEGKGHKLHLMARQAEPKDDRGQGKGQPEPGDDRGRGKGRA